MNNSEKTFCKAYHVMGLYRAVCSLAICFIFLYSGIKKNWTESFAREEGSPLDLS